ncbi:MAG: type ISP restriction/modification enzyme, partial [Bacteroidia bacterium]
MKNTLLYCPLQYRHSLLSDTNITIALLVYQENTGEIQFFEGEKELLEIKKMYPTIKQTILNTYFEIIRKQIQKFPPEKKLEREGFQTYIYHYLLPKDDTSLQFGVVGTAENLNGNIKEKINFYKTLFLPQTFEGKKILQTFDAFLTQYAKGRNQILITKNGKVDKQFSICADRAWKIGGISYFLWAADLSTQRSQQTLQIKIQEWQELLNVAHKESDKFHFWIIPPLDDKKKEVYIKEIKTKLAPLPIEIFLPEQWVEYVKSIVQTTENSNMKKAIISYFSLADEMRKEEKLQWFRENKLQSIAFERITPDEKGNWINLADNSEWDTLLPVCSKGNEEKAIFEFSSLGVSTNRDEWVYDFSKENLQLKMQFFINSYNELFEKQDFSWKEEIKWSRDLKKKFERGQRILFDENLIVNTNYRPFISIKWYVEKALNDIFTQNHYDIFGKELKNHNQLININKNGKDIRFFASGIISDLHFLG